MAILIFPAGMPRAIGFLGECLKQNKKVVGASSVRQDPSREQYPQWAYLPYVNDPGFASALAEAIKGHGITQIYSANPVVWGVLNIGLPQFAPGVTLLGESPAVEMLAGYRSSKQVADMLWNHRDFLALTASAQARMRRDDFTALVRHADTIPGMCDHQKLLTLSEIFRIAPLGDVVEIGSWWGKSAFILAHLARRYRIGNLLCIDPWSDAHLVQDDNLVDDASAEISAEEAHQVFVANLLPYSNGNINFIRMPSVEGAAHYRKNRNITTGAFGETNYVGKISVLHIDGNHALKAVKEDTAFLQEESQATKEARDNSVRPLPLEKLLNMLGYDYSAKIEGRREAYDRGSIQELVKPKPGAQPTAPATPKDEAAPGDRRGEFSIGEDLVPT